MQGDSETVFRALHLADGNYLVSWKSKSNHTAEIMFTNEEMSDALELRHYILTNENGE